MLQATGKVRSATPAKPSQVASQPLLAVCDKASEFGAELVLTIAEPPLGPWLVKLACQEPKPVSPVARL